MTPSDRFGDPDHAADVAPHVLTNTRACEQVAYQFSSTTLLGLRQLPCPGTAAPQHAPNSPHPPPPPRHATTPQ